MADTVYAHESVAEADAHAPAAHIEHDTNTGISNTKLAMWLFLASECLLFGGLITTYLLYKHPLEQGPTPKEIYDIPFTSSQLVRAADELAHHGAGRRPPSSGATTTASGSGSAPPRCSAPPSSPARSTSSPCSCARASATPPAASRRPSTRSTGFHGVHVTVGIIMLVSLLLLSLRGKLPEHRSETVEIVGLYWHFVDVVWIFIFAVVYLIP